MQPVVLDLANLMVFEVQPELVLGLFVGVAQARITLLLPLLLLVVLRSQSLREKFSRSVC